MQDALVAGIITGNTYALIAVGISLIFGVADLINFAHGSVFAIGAMVGWWLVAKQSWPLWAAMVGVVLVTAALGLAIERVALRPLVNAPPIAPLLSTVAIGLILDRSSELIFSPETQRFSSKLDTNNFSIGQMRFGTLDLTILGVSLGSVAALWFFLARARLGRALRATAQDRDAARQMGVNVGAIQGLAFAIASALAGIGGVLVGMYYSNVQPSIGFNAGIAGFTAAMLGGLGNLPGAVVGGLLLGIAESLGVTWFGGSTRQLISFAVLVGVLWLRPNGLFGSSRIAPREPLTGTFFGRGAAVRLQHWQVAILGVLAAIVLPLWGNGYHLQTAGIVVIFAILGLSLTLPSGTAGQVSLGQAGFFAIGAYASALLTTEHGWSFWLALPVAGLIAAVLGGVAVAPALGLRGHYVAIATLGIGAMVVAVILNWESLTHGPLGVFGIPAPEIFGRSIFSARDYYLLAGAVLVLCLVLNWRLQRSQLGRVWRSIREDEVAARSMGVGLAGYKSLAFAVGAFVAGLAGSLLAHQYSFISPEVFGFQISLLALTIVVLGGMSNNLGTILGAAILVGAPELFRPLEDYRILAYGLLLLVLVRFRPQGLLGIQ
ncbi:MAG: branched-chain amino acid transport system permease protein livM [Thermomicrobiales bacterium]|nr:branched-chain amino acid transport system permease protein livM [Thermomicrobiales bacterium]